MQWRPEMFTDLMNVKVGRFVNDDRICAVLPVTDGGLAQGGAGVGA